MKEVNTIFYIGRVNIYTGEHQIVRQEDFDKLFRQGQTLPSYGRYENARDVNVIVNAFNNISTHFGQEYYYYVRRRDENESVNMNGIDEKYHQFFESPEELPGVIPEEEDADEDTAADGQDATE